MRHKEQMKALRAEVDVLTLTATPIPRTLGMALEGLRDLSVIATAPQRRLAIKTFVRDEGSSTIREAVLRELKRGGQVYFLHNDVETIEHRRETLQALVPGGAHRRRPRPDARARARARDARLRRPALQRAALLDHHRDRHRRAERQHDRHQPRRQVRPGAAAPAARPRRPLAPPGLRLPHGARRAGPDQAGSAAARGDPADGRARLGLLPRDARPRDPRRRRGARRQPERQHDGGRLPALQRHARRGGALAEERPRARPAGAAFGGDRDQPARAGAAARRLLRRRAHPPLALQAAREREQGRADRRAARGDHRPLRQAAAAGAGALRRAPPARPRQGVWRRPDRCRRRR